MGRFHDPFPTSVIQPLYTALGAAGENASGIRIHNSVEFGLLAMDAYRMEAKAAA